MDHSIILAPVKQQKKFDDKMRKHKSQLLKRSLSSDSLSISQTISKYAKTVITTDKVSPIDIHEYFFNERPFCNTKILINSQIIYVDKASLAAASPVLCEQLQCKQENEPLKFDDINLNDLLEMLQFIYPIFDPEINDKNITALIELSHRFRFDVLKHACQYYVFKHLTTVRRVLGKCSACGDFNNDNIQKQFINEHDLIEFRNRTCLDASDEICLLCRWLKIYYYDDNSLTIKNAIITILNQCSVNSIEKVINSINMDDKLKCFIYKERARYLEKIIIK
ncbi:unnamed protein product [Didymodactylos carnosus]|uniref:BTB domain-containing protein n=1 Tax=Didymodactylos carnosus TaxID=1234261 RepID=A0A814Q3S7_9BILA|nr:unnamed protein product [Didymodactylos carnosus]CAF1147531.1 unnamed protein product [Didymodactylos carnosus]CAF3878175.1 unnamed protein product [Didymodactylos carnosus]CAF3950657.1 unnamed protein product [Didymodactylos carnosus]